jgi:hypothetical protein
MHHRILVPCEADVANLAGLFASSSASPALVEKPVRVFHADILVILHEVHPVRLQRCSDSSICFAVAALVRPSNFVIRNTFWR